MIWPQALPPQQLPFSRKTKEWRKKHLDWASTKAIFNHSLVRKSVLHKKINYDLLDGKLNMADLEIILNPTNVQLNTIPDRIQHYPIMNSKLNVLRGEESKRLFDYRVVVTDPSSISAIEEERKKELTIRMNQLLEDQELSEEEFSAELEKLNDNLLYEWQDLREKRANSLLSHYIKELSLPLKFNQGFMDALAVGEELYQIDIVGGEPVVERLNPLKVRIFQSGYSNRVEDADVIILEDYWSLGKIIDTFYDVLTKADIENLTELQSVTQTDEMYHDDIRQGFIHESLVSNAAGGGYYFNVGDLFTDAASSSTMYCDSAGNIRVIRKYWKSRRKIKKVKSYDQETGEEVFDFYPETYKVNKALGEEEEVFWINEAWEGTLLGKEIYVNMRPRIVQYNRLSNPSRCHFGIIGSIYNLNEAKPFSMVDIMKPYSYLYDVIHDRLNRELANNWGKLIELDLAMVPSGWTIDKWFYYARANGLIVKDSFKEGNVGVAKGKLAGGFANATRGVLDAELGNSIQQYINLLSFIKLEMSEVAGISPQREGQISNRETVGGVERATLQSSHITEWYYVVHDDVKKRVCEALLETAKIALQGRSKKFQYLLSDMSLQIMEIDGDEFSESDYGLLVENSEGLQKLNSQLDMLAQAAMQNQLADFSTIMKMYTSVSMAEKQRLLEKSEQNAHARAEQAQQAELQVQQEALQAKTALEQQKLVMQDEQNRRDNEVKLLIAEMKLAESSSDGINIEEYSEKDRAELMEKIRQFDEKLKLDREKFNFDKQQAKIENTQAEKTLEIKEKAVKQKVVNRVG